MSTKEIVYFLPEFNNSFQESYPQQIYPSAPDQDFIINDKNKVLYYMENRFDDFAKWTEYTKNITFHDINGKRATKTRWKILPDRKNPLAVEAYLIRSSTDGVAFQFSKKGIDNKIIGGDELAYKKRIHSFSLKVAKLIDISMKTRGKPEGSRKFAIENRYFYRHNVLIVNNLLAGVRINDDKVPINPSYKKITLKRIKKQQQPINKKEKGCWDSIKSLF